MIPPRQCLRIFAIFMVYPLLAAEHRGVVEFGGLPVPGVTVIATRDQRKVSTITNAQGVYLFPELADGTWSLDVQMQAFAEQHRDVTVAPNAPPDQWDLQLLSKDELAKLVTAPTGATQPSLSITPTVTPAKSGKATSGKAKSDKAAPVTPQTPFQRTEIAATQAAPASAATSAEAPEATSEASSRAADGLLVNGSVSNAATSPFAQLPAFGNNRRGVRSLYNGNLGLILDNAALDARSFSLTGQDTPKPAYSRVRGLASFGGPLKIPHLLPRNGPLFTVNYQWTRNRNATTQTGLVPTLDQRAGILSPAETIPTAMISPQALALLKYYPLPNFAGSSRYNYQLPVVNGLHEDDLQARMNKLFGRKDQVSGTLGWQNVRTDNPGLFGFLDTGRTNGSNTTAQWRHSFNPRTFLTLGYQYSRYTNRVTPYFANRQNVSGLAGVTGNNQDPMNWGPPSLIFAGGISELTDAQASLNRNQTSGLSADAYYNRGRHNITAGIAFRKQQFNVLSQQDPRGTFTFTGAGTGSDFRNFLLGTPDTASIAYGNADKYLRGSTTATYINDDWRMNPGFTLNLGLRYEYSTPVTEKYGRLVNLTISPGYSAVTPVLGAAASPHSDRRNLSPRIAFSWRPLAGSSMVVRGGYGIYYDTSVYQTIALQMAQQAPLSTSLRVQNSAANPLTLADAFGGFSATTPSTFAVDPNFHIGYSQNWQLSVQRDLPAGLQLTATYNGVKGTHAQQEFLPNTFPAGTFLTGPFGPSGYTFLTSSGNSTRESGQIQLRRRLRSGLTAQLQYVYSKSIDDAALGGKGNLIAQNWLDLSAERARSNFDQRHLLTAQGMYTTGMGLHGGALTKGWRAVALKDWMIGAQINVGTGLPLTPVYLAPVSGTGVTGSLRPDYTGAPLYNAPLGLSINPAAFTTPAPGTWGNAGRNSITGPAQFTLNASLGRTFRSSERWSLDVRAEAANVLNHVTFPSWNTVLGSAQFGLPATANAMRTVQLVVRTRF